MFASNIIGVLSNFELRESLMICFMQGRGGLGAIYTFAAGNGGITGDSCAYNGYVNSIYTIAINGVNLDGSNPSYAEECPGIMATAYSGDIFRNRKSREYNKTVPCYECAWM